MMLSDVNLVKQTIIFCLVLNRISFVKPVTRRLRYMYAAVGTTTKVCPLGYTGRNCNLTCQYPSYGQDCQNKCNCNQPHCDHRTGCRGCPVGFIGTNCEVECRYPSFGFQCQQNCSCEEKRCNHMEGCRYGCPVGFIGTNCEVECRYPSFGFQCQQNCSCEEKRCNHMEGCRYGCPVGFIGTNCEIECRYPSFGFQCQQNCSCEEKRCNHMEGCRYDLTTNNMVTSTKIYTLTTTQDELEYTVSQVHGREHTFSSKEDIINNENKPALIPIITIVLSIFALILVCVYISTFAVRPWPQETENNVLKIHRNSDQV